MVTVHKLGVDGAGGLLENTRRCQKNIGAVPCFWQIITGNQVTRTWMVVGNISKLIPWEIHNPCLHNRSGDKGDPEIHVIFNWPLPPWFARHFGPPPWSPHPDPFFESFDG